MIVDTSAVVALLLGGPEADAISDKLHRENAVMSAVTLVELGAVVGGKLPPQQRRRVDALLDVWQVDIVPFTPSQARIARDAYQDFGRGSGHPARLNLGDCFTYALAAERDDEILYVGDDFSQTDARSALDR